MPLSEMASDRVADRHERADLGAGDLLRQTSILFADLVDVGSLRLRLRPSDVYSGGAGVAVLAAVSASIWLAANSSPFVWFLWVPMPALIAAVTFGSEPHGRRRACLVTGIVVCLVGTIFILWGWFLYIPAGLILIITSALPAY